MATGKELSTIQETDQLQVNTIEKKDLTDAQICGCIIYVFHCFPDKAYLTTADIFRQIQASIIINIKRLETILMQLAEGGGIEYGIYENKEKEIYNEKHWYWSIKMAIKNQGVPIYHRVLENKKDNLA